MNTHLDRCEEAMESFDVMAREVIPFQQYDRFMRSIRRFRVFYQLASKERPPADPKKLAADIDALERVVALLNPVSEASAVETLGRRLEAAKRRLSMKNNQRTIAELKEFMTADVLNAISIAMGVHVGRLSVGQNPDTAPASCDLPLVIAALATIGISESEGSTYKRAGRLIREARPDAEFDEEMGVDFQRRAEIIEGKDPVVF